MLQTPMTYGLSINRHRRLPWMWLAKTRPPLLPDMLQRNYAELEGGEAGRGALSIEFDTTTRYARDILRTRRSFTSEFRAIAVHHSPF